MTLSTESEAALLAALAWQVELGADECISDDPINRFEVPKPVVEPAPAAQPIPLGKQQASRAVSSPAVDQMAEVVTEAQRLARGADTLEALHAAMSSFEGSSLKRGAKNTVFADGDLAARVMFIGEAPGREEDRAGTPFVGRSGQLLDRMLAAIGLDRRTDEPDKAAYITNVIPWRPVENRDPSTDEAVILWAFLERHIELVRPEFIVTLGKISSSTMMEKPVSITRARGRWHSPTRASGRPLLLTLHPAYLLRQPGEKAKSWRDLLSLRAALDGEAPTIEK
jgi:uracil-DNA glycosylase family 4